MFQTRITQMLGIKYPIVGGTMASISNADFVAAISEAGGIGVLNSVMYQTKDEFAAALDRVRKLTDKPFAVNLNFFPARFPVSQSEYTEVMGRKGVKVVETSGHTAPPLELCKRFKELGMIWIHKCAGARYAVKAESLGADIVTVVGYENGGAVGRLEIGTLVMVPTVAQRLKVPLIGGGGVVDGRSMLAVLALGAEGVIMGTRLLATQECPIHSKLKQALINATEVDTMVIMRTVGAHRVWINETAKKCADVEAIGASFEEILNLVSGENSRKVYYEGELDRGVVPCGQGVGQIHDIPTVKELFDGMVKQASDIANRLAKS
ncbi:MAG: nitronate monooxygenase family protein [Dehalococcoidia bacterium]|nr:nitronate monooxygenase family protein [Dehalococcoidia bacterium]